MKYKDYQTEDFLSDSEFIKWILKPDRDLDKYWHAVIENHPEKKDAIQEAITLAKTIHFKKLASSLPRKNRILANTIANVYSSRSNAQNDKKGGAGIKIFRRVAASILLICTVVSFLWFQMNNESENEVALDQETPMISKQNPAGRKTRFNLPDGTMVVLNAQSKIEFPSQFVGKREVWLEGEAFFDVAKDTSKVFLVHSQNLTTQVTGTSFNVMAYPEQENQAISLVEGKVQILHTYDEKVTYYELSPGEKLTMNENNEQPKLSLFNPDDIVWHKGILIFKEENMDQFINKIERWYGVTVHLTGQPSEVVNINGKFDNENLENVLESLKFSLGISYKINGDNVYIKF